MKKIIKLPIESTTQIRKTEDSLCELYSHDKNNGLFEFEVTNVKLGNEKPYAMFKFMDSMSVWKVLGTIEDNKIKVAFDTTLITQDETVVCFLYLDDEERTTDFYRFKFKVKVSEIDKLDTYAVKERYFNNSIIVDKVDVVTKKELEEALKGLTVSSVEGVLTETRADELYAKKSEIYDDTALRQRVATLEERPNNNTVYDDSDLRGRVIALESKADNDTVYDDADLKRRVSELENKSDKDTVYDDTDVQNRLKAIEDTQKDYVRTEDLPAPYDDRRVNERLEALETKTDNDTVYNDTGLKTRVEALENRTTTSVTAYDDSDLKRRVSELEQRPDNNTVYDDTDVKERLTNLETKVDKDTIYDDSDLKRRLTNLEQRPDNNTVYDDTALSGRVKALEDAPKVDVTNFATKDDVVAFNRELNNKVSSVDFEAFKTTIPAPYNDKELSDRVLALENKPATAGIQTQDTGWITISDDNPLHGNVVKIRRINDVVHVSLSNSNSEGLQLQLDDTVFHVILANKEIGEGFTPLNKLAIQITEIENIMQTTTGGTNVIGQVIFKVENGKVMINGFGDKFSTSEPIEVLVNNFSYFTEDPFPTNLN